MTPKAYFASVDEAVTAIIRREYRGREIPPIVLHRLDVPVIVPKVPAHRIGSNIRWVARGACRDPQARRHALHKNIVIAAGRAITTNGVACRVASTPWADGIYTHHGKLCRGAKDPLNLMDGYDRTRAAIKGKSRRFDIRNTTARVLAGPDGVTPVVILTLARNVSVPAEPLMNAFAEQERARWQVGEYEGVQTINFTCGRRSLLVACFDDDFAIRPPLS